MNGVFLFYRKCLIDDMGPINRTVIHIDLNLFTQQLLPFVPKNRIAIHSKAGIFRIENQRIANTLQIDAVHTHFVESTHLTEKRICVKIIAIHQ